MEGKKGLHYGITYDSIPTIESIFKTITKTFYVIGNEAYNPADENASTALPAFISQKIG